MKNPKIEGSGIVECKPQVGKCPNDCNQCYYNRNEEYCKSAIYPLYDTEKIVRVNAGHDSNSQREMVIAITEQYKYKFFNTSIPRFDFPGPVVFTANPQEEQDAVFLHPSVIPDNLMFVRLRVSSVNIEYIERAIGFYTEHLVPVVLTFMAYYDCEPSLTRFYEWKKRHINDYWCPKESFKAAVLKQLGNRLVSICGDLCKDCRNCETYYWQTLKRMT